MPAGTWKLPPPSTFLVWESKQGNGARRVRRECSVGQGPTSRCRKARPMFPMYLNSNNTKTTENTGSAIAPVRPTSK